MNFELIDDRYIPAEYTLILQKPLNVPEPIRRHNGKNYKLLGEAEKILGKWEKLCCLFSLFKNALFSLGFRTEPLKIAKENLTCLWSGKKVKIFYSSSTIKSLPKDIRTDIKNQNLKAGKFNACLQATLGERYAKDLQPILPALQQAEKTRMYFNSKGIPVGYTTRGFEDYVISAILKNKTPTAHLSDKGVKPLVPDSTNADIALPDAKGHLNDVFCLCSNLYDSRDGESHLFFMEERAESHKDIKKHKPNFKEQIREIVRKNQPNAKDKVEDIYKLYIEYKKKLQSLQQSKLLYTVAFTDLDNNINTVRLSKEYGHSDEQPADINKYLLDCNHKMPKRDLEDCPQLRAVMPAANKDNGIRMFRCYTSGRQKDLHKEFKEKLKEILHPKVEPDDGRPVDQ